MHRKPDEQIKILPYLRGKRKGKEAHRLERISMTDAFLADAMEGFETVPGDHASAIKRLQTAVAGKSRSGTYAVRYWAAIAASLLLLGGAGLLLLRKETPELPPQENILADRTELFPIDDAKKPSAPELAENRSAVLKPEPDMQETAETAAVISEEIQDRLAPPAVITVAENEKSSAVDTSPSGDIRHMAEMKHLIRGLVTDESGQPLPGATLQVKDAHNGVFADREGRFEMEAADSAVIVASFVGYRNSEFKADTSPLLIAMQENSEALDEVVVVAFGRQKKQSPVGAVATVAGPATEETAEKLPQPVIGKKAYRRYLERHRVRPGGACAGVKGEVVIRFGVDENRRPAGLTVEQSLCPDADREAMRLITEGCDWVRGTKDATVTVKF
ncbi:MAG: carboxypeptidase-like regulatory domain-containing protein [Bacteroidales bacterium]|jgi:hypothetical protein|nr:carboxypeptidase-like regulatory domain-containing protein [Bacteroidales bacterium]